jgi:hypothetical protein
MQRRILLSGLLAAALAAATAACSDESPTFGGDQFPPGSTPVTREVLIPASRFLRVLGSYTGYTRGSDAPFLEVAENYQGLYAHGVTRFNTFPRTVTYRRGEVTKTDSAFTFAASRLVARIDTAASTGRPVTLQVWQGTQRFDPATATWELAVDSGSVHTPWTQPGGTRGALLGEATLAPGAGDSLVFTLPAAAVQTLADSTGPGVVLTARDAGTRIHVANLQLRVAVRPDSAQPDTTIIVNTNPFPRVQLFTPGQRTVPEGVLAVGGLGSTRTLVEIDPRQEVPACAAGATCGTVPLAQVQLNSVALLLRPQNVPDGLGPLGSVPLRLRRVTEPELGRFAPLGPVVADAGITPYTSGDTVAVLSITDLALRSSLLTTLPTTFALVSEVSGNTPSGFGVAWFRPDPLLRIVYTLPTRRQLP